MKFKNIFLILILSSVAIINSCGGAFENALGGIDYGYHFGNTSTVSGDNTIEIYCSALQSDRKIIVGGQLYNSTSSTHTSVVARYNRDGTLDTTFGTGGIATGLNSPVHSIAVGFDDSIYAACGMSNANAFIAKYSKNGSLDTGFGSSGIVTSSINVCRTEYSEWEFRKSWVWSNYISLTLQGDGKIVAAGILYPENENTIVVERYNADGTPDNEFDSDGKVTTIIGSLSFRIRCIFIQNDGKILVGGLGGSNCNIILRYDTDGSIDTTFGTSGYKQTSVTGASFTELNSISQQSDGKIIVSGSYNYNALLLIRYNIEGTIDTSFGTSGIVTDTGLGRLYCSAVQSDGKIVAGGYGHVSRYNTDGSLDTTFAANGTYSSIGYFSSLILLPDNRVIASGSSRIVVVE